MKLDLNLLAELLSQQGNQDFVPRNGVNAYLLDKILLPCMNGKPLYLRDIDFDAFDVEDVENLAELIKRQKAELNELVQDVDNIKPVAARFRAYC